MPQTIALALFYLGAPAVITSGLVGVGSLAFLGTAVGALINIGLSIGLSFLAQSLLRRNVPQPKPEDVQQSLRQPTAPRVKHYGRAKVSGPWVFAAAYQGAFHKVLAIGQGPIDAIEEYWIDDTQVTLDGSGLVQTAPWTNKCRIETRLGVASETSYSNLSAVFSEWTPDHAGDHVASLYAKQNAVSSEVYLSTYPNGIQTSYRLVIRGTKLTPFGGGTPVWGDNAASVIYDYLLSDDGMRLPSTVLDTTEALAGWTVAFNRADEAVDLNAGGTEKRYRLWGSYRLDERPADVLARMLAACDGRLKPTADGGLTLDIGDWSEPDVTLDDTVITGFMDISRGRDVLSTANTIFATYMEPGSDYQASDADPWIDAADVSERGEISVDTSFIMSPSHAQTRRLMKLAYYRSNPSWVGTFECNLGGLAIIGERFIRITYPLFSIDDVFEVQDLRFNIEGDTLRSVTVTAQAMPSTAYAWDETLEEGIPPGSDDIAESTAIPDPTGFTVTTIRLNIGGTMIPFAELDMDPPLSAALNSSYRYKTSAEPNWTELSPPSGETRVVTAALQDGVEYEFQSRFVTSGGRFGAWSSSITLTPTADETAPGVVTLNSATGGLGQVDLDWNTPNSGNFSRTVIKRHIADVEGSAVEITSSPVYGAPNTNHTLSDTGLAAGTYYYWLYAANTSGVESAAAASGAVTVT